MADIKARKKTDGRWYLDTGRRTPTRIRKHFPSKKLADKFISRLSASKTIFDGQGRLCLTDQIRRYLSASESTGRKKSETIRRDKSRLLIFATWAEKNGIRQVGDITVENFARFHEYFFANAPFHRVTNRPGRNMIQSKKRNWMNYRGSISALINWAINIGEAKTNSTTDKRFKYKKVRNIPPRFTTKELRQIFEYLDNEDPLFAAVIRLLAYTGIRPWQEVWNLRLENIDIRRRILRVAVTKTDEPRTIGINKKLIPYLKMLSGGRKRGLLFDSPLWSDSWALVKLHRACDARGIPRRRIYDIRHSFGAAMAEKIPLAKLKQIMGHKHLSTTQNYIHYSPDEFKNTTDLLDY